MIYLVIAGLYLLFIAVVVFVCHRKGMSKAKKVMVAVILLLLPFWDLLLSKGMMWHYALWNHPLQRIVRTVDRPGSVVWIDNVWPGFDEYGRAWMVANYLDGVRLKVLGLNDGEGHLYVYRAEAEDFAASEKMRPVLAAAKQKYDNAFAKAGRITKEVVSFQSIYFDINGSYRAQRKREAIPILARPEIYPYTGKRLPPELSFNYRIEFTPSDLSGWQKRFIWCDEMHIRDNISKEEIAVNKRCLEYSPMFAPILIGGSPFEGGVRLGDMQVYEFDDKVLFGYSGVRDSIASTRANLERNTYKTYYSIRWERRHKKQGAMNNAK